MMPDSTTPQTPHIPEDDLVLFALQLLPDDRMMSARQHMESCDRCRTDIAKLQGDLVAYSVTAEMQEPPAGARDRLMRQVAKEPRVRAPEPTVAAAGADRAPARAPDRAPASSEPVIRTRQNRLDRVEARDEEPDELSEPKDRRPARRAPWVLAGVGWALAAGACFFAGLQFRQREQMQGSMADQQARLDQTTTQATHAQDALATLTAANAMQVALHAPTAAPGAKPVGAKPGAPAAAPSPEAVAAYLADKGALVFVAVHLEPAPAGKTYELWLLPADGRNPMPAGTFRPDAQGAASIVMPQIPKGVPAKGFGVTVENDGGSDTPTMPLAMSGS
jgi:hypothetical protein